MTTEKKLHRFFEYIGVQWCLVITDLAPLCWRLDISTDRGLTDDEKKWITTLVRDEVPAAARVGFCFARVKSVPGMWMPMWRNEEGR